MKFLKNLASDKRGATAIEYGLIAALISVAIITGATTLGNTLSNTFQNISNQMNTASAAH